MMVSKTTISTWFSGLFSGMFSSFLSVLFSSLLVSFVFNANTVHAARSATASLQYMPVQDGGRIKPYDTFARESLHLIYGKQTYEGREALEIVTTWLLAPQIWENKKIVQIQHSGLKESLRLPKTEKYFSTVELFASDRIGLVFQELSAKRETKVKLDPYYQAVQRLESQLGLMHMIRNGQTPRLVPPKTTGGETGDSWRAIRELDGPIKERFEAVAKAFISALPQPKEGQGSPPDPATSGAAAAELLAKEVDAFIQAARAENPAAYGDPKPIDVEVHFNNLHPFFWTWILYLIAALMLAVAWHLRSKDAGSGGGSAGALFYKLGWSVMAGAFLFHSYGFGLRMYLTGRPPVSNMYESVVWVSWGAVMFSMVFESMNRRAYILLAGASVGVLCLITANLAPAVLDSSLQPLEPVLRSTLWLTIHVLTITISYSAFFLAWALSMIGLSFVLKGEAVSSERVRGIAQSVYRAVQIGVVLIAAGTILGGVWADYSWGRFWGWDPKETWALIALLGYLALLHGRLTGWVQNFGLMAGSVIAFSLVIMAWYGVNFVLGAGLHSYGFGAGGVEYVAGFVLLNIIYVGYVAYVRKALMVK